MLVIWLILILSTLLSVESRNTVKIIIPQFPTDKMNIPIFFLSLLSIQTTDKNVFFLLYIFNSFTFFKVYFIEICYILFVQHYNYVYFCRVSRIHSFLFF